ncbi:MAG: DUF2175 family protein [Pyrobaculum sp.]
MRQLKRWKCVICGEDIIEGQVFTFYAKGPVHWECLEKELAPKIYKDVNAAALLRLDHYLHEGIVLAKELEYLATSDEVKIRITEIRKQLEALAARLTNEITGKQS